MSKLKAAFNITSLVGAEFLWRILVGIGVILFLGGMLPIPIIAGVILHVLGVSEVSVRISVAVIGIVSVLIGLILIICGVLMALWAKNKKL